MAGWWVVGRLLSAGALMHYFDRANVSPVLGRSPEPNTVAAAPAPARSGR